MATEINSRENSGISVELHFFPEDGKPFKIFVRDEKAQEFFELSAKTYKMAEELFWHPFAYRKLAREWATSE